MKYVKQNKIISDPIIFISKHLNLTFFMGLSYNILRLFITLTLFVLCTTYYHLSQSRNKITFMQNVRYDNAELDDVDQGFQRSPQTEEFIVQAKSLDSHFNGFDSIVLAVSKKKSKYLSDEKPNMKLMALDNFRKHQNGSYNYIKSSSLKKDFQKLQIEETNEDQYEDGINNRAKKIKLRMKRDKSASLLDEIMQSVMFKTKRTEIGENLIIKVENKMHSQKIKEQLSQNPNYLLVYKQKSSVNTYSFFHKLMKMHNPYFINSKFNTLLKKKLQRAKLKNQEGFKFNNPIDFCGDFQCGNLDYTIKISDNQYDVYLRIDTNTQGHQSWFYFKVTNNQSKQTRIQLNICNITKRFRMMQWGQKVCIKQFDSQNEWQQIEQQVQLIPTGSRKYKISFQIQLPPSKAYLVSLIPPYTYSDVLKDIQIYEQSPNVKVDILTYSLTGLAIPILTITKDAKDKKSQLTQFKKKLFLISGRIHPSQTCSSYIINSFIRQLISEKDEIQDFLQTTVVKIIPMLNPDGVIFGNFRTNYLGEDLNRSFHHSDDSVYPQTVALKQIGRLYKEDYGDNFVGFLDMHGHSSQSNSFVYGPEYEDGSDSFIECRIFPKILDQISRYFKYDMSSFRLEQYKNNTARGYFSKKLKIPSYTIQTSYALFNQKGQTSRDDLKQMSIKQWSDFGLELCRSLGIYSSYLSIIIQKKINQTGLKKLKQQKKTIEMKVSTNKSNNMPTGTCNNELPIIKKQKQFKFPSLQQLRKQILNEVGVVSIKKQNKSQQSQSDGEGIDEDLPQKQKQMLIKKVREAVYPNFLFPRVLKPAIILPSVVPSIVVLGTRQTKQLSTMPRLANKFKNKRFNRPLNINHEYTEYLLKNISGISALRPQVINYHNLKRPKVVDLTIEESKSQN